MVKNELLQSLSAYKKILNFSYHFVIGRKNQTVDIILKFSKKDFFHLVGLQYLNDIRELNNDREKIFNRIECDYDFINLILNSINYFKITERVNFVTTLEEFLDSNKTVFKFNNRTNIFSLIDAEYILKNSDITKNMYVFISREDTNSNTYFCRSAFSRDKSERDYAIGHTSYTLLYKEKIDLITKEKQVLYTHPSYKKGLEQHSALSQQQQNDNIKQIKFDSPTPQNILHSNSGAATAVLPSPNPFKNLIDRLKNIFKKQDKHVKATTPVQTNDKTNISENKTIVNENLVPKELTALIEAREAFAAGNLPQAEYEQAVSKYMYSLHGREMWTEAAESFRKQLEECPDNMKKYIGFELKSIELNIGKKFPPQRQQTLAEIKSAAHEQYVKLQAENKAAEKEITTEKNKTER